MATRLALRIQDRFEKLAPSEQKLAALLLKFEDEILTYSATELAGLAGVSKTTAARLFQHLGYRDFNDVRMQAREERNRTGPVHRVVMPVDTPTSATSIASHLTMEVANLTRSFEDLRSDLVGMVAQRLCDAPRVWILGMGDEEGLARHARLLLARVRPDVHLLGGQAGAWAEDLAMAGASDALLVLATRPRPKRIAAITEFCSTTRMAMVALVDPTSVATFKRLGALPLACHTAHSFLGPSHTTVLSLVQLLALATAIRIGAGAHRRIALISEIHEEIDDLDG
jgi:DNA-binding MurR/RpiR family transcriptional regulator